MVGRVQEMKLVGRKVRKIRIKKKRKVDITLK
jgi:hypothetical protein